MIYSCCNQVCRLCIFTWILCRQNNYYYLSSFSFPRIIIIFYRWVLTRPDWIVTGRSGRPRVMDSPIRPRLPRSRTLVESRSPRAFSGSPAGWTTQMCLALSACAHSFSIPCPSVIKLMYLPLPTLPLPGLPTYPYLSRLLRTDWMTVTEHSLFCSISSPSFYPFESCIPNNFTSIPQSGTYQRPQFPLPTNLTYSPPYHFLRYSLGAYLSSSSNLQHPPRTLSIPVISVRPRLFLSTFSLAL